MREPPGVLGEIVARKRVDVAARLAGRSLDDLRGRAEPTTRSLRQALEQPGARFVMEVKRASPSQGELRAALKPKQIADAYNGVADVVSVLTDEPFFGGSYKDLRAVRKFLDCPILCKDFVVDPRQVPEARGHGADAILLMLSVLDDEEARVCLAECEQLGMDALVEAHTSDEVDRAVALDASVIGINNRDLTTLKVDLAATERLAARVPIDRVLVTESGIGNRDDVQRLAPIVDAFLVGSSLMRSEDVGFAARALVFGPVKICGLTRASDVVEAGYLGATHFGMIYAEDSPRYIGARDKDLVEEAYFGPHFIRPVGVFRHDDGRRIRKLAERHGLHAVQLHDAPASPLALQLRRRLPERCEVWGVAPVDEDGIGEPPIGSQRVVFDTARQGRSGGTGRRFDWSSLADRPDLGRAILAGGLDPTNIREAQAVGTWALDVNSGVEESPGIKSREKMAALFAALRPPSRQDAQP